MFNVFSLEEASTFFYSEHINTNCFISNTFIISMKATFLHFPFWASCANLNIAMIACTVRESREASPVGDEQRGVHEPVHTVGDAGLLSAGEAGAGVASDTSVPADLVDVVHLCHHTVGLLGHLKLGLKISSGSC